MTQSAFPSLHAEGVAIQPRPETGALRLVMSGTLESRDPRTQFDPYWLALDEAVRRERLPRVILDIRGLDYMNSSGILTLARWLMKVAAEPAYEITIDHDPDVTWQNTNVPVLAKLAPGLVKVTPPGGPAKR